MKDRDRQITEHIIRHCDEVVETAERFNCSEERFKSNIHAHCDGQSVSIALDGTVLEGRIRSDKLKEVKNWVTQNADFLKSEWRRIHGV